MSVKVVIAHHPYEAQREDEISFDKDEVIKVTDFSDPDWWVGKKKDGSLGFFPSNFVHESDDEPKEETKQQQGEETIEKENIPPQQEQQQQQQQQDESVEEEAEQKPVVVEKKEDQVIGMARVMEDYAMQENGELSLHRGGIVNVFEVIDDEWSRGELNGKVGKYPSKYVEEIDMPGGRPDLGKQLSGDVQKPASGEEDAPKGGFKLAAFGVKQGGIGSLLAGGFPGLKKTGAAKPAEEPKPAVVEEPKVEPKVEPEVKPEPVPETKEESAPAAPVHHEEEKPKSLGKAIVLHPYDAESEDELSLLRGEYVEILDRDIDDGWWKGLNERGQSGVFPNNFVRELDEESIAPPTPTRARRSVQSNTSSPITPGGAVPPPVPDNRPTSVNSTTSMARPPQVPRPASVQTPTTARPISVQPTAQRPSSISHTNSTGPLATPPRILAAVPQQVASPSIIEESKEEEEDVQEEEEIKSPVESIEKVQSPPAAVERKASVLSQESVASPSPVVAERQASVLSQDSITSLPPASIERQPSLLSEDSILSPAVERKASLSLDEGLKSSPVVKEDPISDQEEKESGAEEIASPAITARDIKPAIEEEKVKEEEEKKDEPIVPQQSAVVEEKKKDDIEEKKDEDSEDEFKDATEQHKEEEKTEETLVVEQVEEKNELDIVPTGPKLTAPSRVRIGGGRARRSPQTPSHEPSQTEILQKELEQEKEEPKPELEEKKEAPSPPAKPVKPIFAKFPTPFATGGAISKTHLKPTQTRKLWDEKPEEKAPTASTTNTTEEESSGPVRPSGVKNIASRFNFAGNTGGGSNEVLETKLKNHTKNEVEKVRREFEYLLDEEREKRVALEELVQGLIEKLSTLEQ